MNVIESNSVESSTKFLINYQINCNLISLDSNTYNACTDIDYFQMNPQSLSTRNQIYFKKYEAVYLIIN